MFQNILILCVGNLCRSPMAATLLTAALATRAGADSGALLPRQASVGPGVGLGAGSRVGPANDARVQVVSAGLEAVDGLPADPMAQALLAERGIDLSAHRSRALRPAMLRNADLILVMEEVQRRFLLGAEPAAAGKTWLLGHWDGTEIADPYRQPIAAYENALARIDRAITGWLPRL